MLASYEAISSLRKMENISSCQNHSPLGYRVSRLTYNMTLWHPPPNMVWCFVDWRFGTFGGSDALQFPKVQFGTSLDILDRIVFIFHSSNSN